MLPQQLWRLGVDLTTRPGGVPAGPGRGRGQIATCLGRFDELDSRLEIPMRQLRRTLTNLTATDAAEWTPVQVLDAHDACRRFLAAAATVVGGFADLWPYPSPAE